MSDLENPKSQRPEKKWPIVLQANPEQIGTLEGGAPVLFLLPPDYSVIPSVGDQVSIPKTSGYSINTIVVKVEERDRGITAITLHKSAY